MTELTEQVRREIGQHFVFGFHGHDVSEDIRTLIAEYYLGNVILMKRNVQSIAQVNALVCQLQQLAKDAGHARPLMIGIDQENGLVSALSSSVHSDAGTQFPGAMALAATGSTEIAEQVSAASGKEMRMAGINWVYSPVADVNSDARNPVIGVRSFGDDPNEVARYVQAVSHGLSSAGIAPSAKHFPGHGNTHVDSHLSLPVINTTKADLYTAELVPFATLIQSGIASIMTGHMALPLIDTAHPDTPASLSAAVTTDLLRRELRFEGVIVTDCLEMEAVAQRAGGVPAAAVQALAAGADVVMACHRFDRHVASIRAAWAAVSRGELSLDALTQSGRRVAALKDAWAGTWADVLNRPLDLGALATAKDAHARLSTAAYASTTAVLRAPAEALPLRTAGTAVLFSPRVESINPAVDDAAGVARVVGPDGRPVVRNTAGPAYEAFAAALARRVPTHHVVYAPGDAESLTVGDRERVRAASEVVFTVRNGFGEKGGWQVEYLRELLRSGVVDASRQRVALVSTCAPYDVLSLSGTEPDGLLAHVAQLATFEFTIPALAACAAALFGENVPGGRPPVPSDLHVLVFSPGVRE
ncbi:glycoside hydrolase family 3 protein [Wolfiporia cocos MD-104 SS10]|uniref:Glycoside hydrolase family 3 protein n=1 Tax=Wolfiporia cocos (strain MD-104) TaxID=742152 RepID=A0A2H3JLI3_WOLCO|nr:glycoside hydrolase family 3 protein [Wolfiporia cocos MD-104 SS10]